MTATRIALDGVGAITISEGAEKFMRRMVRFGGVGLGGGFRLTVSPGGCSGLSSDFTVENEAKPGDETLVVNGLKVFLPAASAQLLAGATIDFVDTAMQQGLQFHSPNVTGSCSDKPKPTLVPLTELARR